MKFSKETQEKLDKLSPESREKVLTLVAQKVALEVVKERKAKMEQDKDKAS
jgi:hypothetical protein